VPNCAAKETNEGKGHEEELRGVISEGVIDNWNEVCRPE